MAVPGIRTLAMKHNCKNFYFFNALLGPNKNLSKSVDQQLAALEDLPGSHFPREAFDLLRFVLVH